MLKKACDFDSDNALYLARAAKVVRKEMYTVSFNGTFSEDSLQNAIPQSLLALVNMRSQHQAPNSACHYS